jgi:hypothetical protein
VKIFSCARIRCVISPRAGVIGNHRPDAVQAALDEIGDEPKRRWFSDFVIWPE